MRSAQRLPRDNASIGHRCTDRGPKRGLFWTGILLCGLTLTFSVQAQEEAQEEPFESDTVDLVELTLDQEAPGSNPGGCATLSYLETGHYDRSSMRRIRRCRAGGLPGGYGDSRFGSVGKVSEA